MHAVAAGPGNYSETGIFAESDTFYGRGIEARVTHPTGPGWAVKGRCSSDNAYSGYFQGGRFAVYTPRGSIGVNRVNPASSNEVFAVERATNSRGGMYVATTGAGKPFYGYATASDSKVYH